MSSNALLIGLALMGFGVIALSWSLFPLRTHRRSQTWPRTAGTILHSELVRDLTSDGVSYEPVIRYTYQVGGVSYTNDRLSILRVATFLSGRERSKVAEYPVGRAVDVYYDPDKPSDSTLEIDAPAFDHIFGASFSPWEGAPSPQVSSSSCES